MVLVFGKKEEILFKTFTRVSFATICWPYRTATIFMDHSIFRISDQSHVIFHISTSHFSNALSFAAFIRRNYGE